MSGHPQGFAAQGGGAQPQRPGPPEFRSPTNGTAVLHRNGQAPVPVPSGPPGGVSHEHRRSTGGVAPPGMGNFSRSPPSTKNTSHVPCKFFRAGNCQAGNACPFSHSAEAAVEIQPCKYFARGNCKFGQKCALAHVLPNGRIVNRPPFAQGGAGQFNGAGAASPVPQYPEPMLQPGMPGQSAVGLPQQHLPIAQQHLTPESYLQPGQRQFDGVAGMEPPFGPGYGTSPSDGFQFGRSPTNWAQPMPDLDPQGNAGYAKFGPFAKSVPSTFGWGPISSTSPTTSTATSTAFRNLDSLARNDAGKAVESNQFGSSPPIGTEVLTARNTTLHSDRRRSKPQMISSSVGARPFILDSSDGDAIEDNDEHGEVYLPDALSELLTPQEKLRRFSRTEEDNVASGRQSLSGFGSPADSKVGSPSNASPSSRFGALFARKRWEEANATTNDSAVGSPFGHVGSPLRNSSLHPETSPRIRPISRPRSRDHSPFGSMINPPAARSSVLSHQLNSLRIQDGPTSNASYYSAMRNVSGASNTSAGTSSSLAGGRMGGRIDEEREQENEQQEEGVFAMDEEELKERERKKRLSGGTPTTGTGTPEIGESSGRLSPASAHGSVGGGDGMEKKKTNAQGVEAAQ